MTDYNINELIEKHKTELYPEMQLQVGSGLMTPPPRPNSVKDKDRMSFFKGDQGIGIKQDESYQFIVDLINSIYSNKKPKQKIDWSGIDAPPMRPEDFKDPNTSSSESTVNRVRPFDRLMNKYENFKAGNPNPSDAIYQGVANEFKDVKVFEMSLAEVLEFTAMDGEYGKAVQEVRGGRPKDFATPVGFYQLTGTLIREIINKSDLFDKDRLNEIPFNKNTQDLMFDWKLDDLTKNKNSMAEYLPVIKNTWVGLRNAEDHEIETAVKAWMEGD